MALPVDFLERLKAANPIAEVMGSYVTLKRTGRDYICLCPFHNDHSPSLIISREKQIFNCFTCRTGGNVFSFVMKYENVSFAEAVSIVAKKVFFLSISFFSAG